MPANYNNQSLTESQPGDVNTQRLKLLEWFLLLHSHVKSDDLKFSGRNGLAKKGLLPIKTKSGLDSKASGRFARMPHAISAIKLPYNSLCALLFHPHGVQSNQINETHEIMAKNLRAC